MTSLSKRTFEMDVKACKERYSYKFLTKAS